MQKKYWETEDPIIVTANKNVLRFYPVAEKLSVARPNWVDDKGIERPGKTVTLDISALLESGAGALYGASELFEEIMQRIDRRLDLIGV